MRNFKMKRTKPIFISKTAFVNITLLSGVVIFVALAVLTGRLVSDSILPGDGVLVDGKPTDIVGEELTPTPTASHVPAPTPTGNTGNNVGTVESVITIAADEYYFVQFGVFTNKSNAEVCAESISSKGGAGYVRDIGGQYQVFAMCYTSSDEAKTVTAEFKEQGYQTMLKCFSHNGLTMALKGNSDNIARLDAAYCGVIKATEEIEKIIQKFDNGEIDRVEFKTELQRLLSQIGQNKEIFEDFQDQNKVFFDAKTLCETFYSDISAIIKCDDDVMLKSESKKIYIKNVFNLIEYLDNVVVG